MNGPVTSTDIINLKGFSIELLKVLDVIKRLEIKELGLVTQRLVK